MKILSGRYWYLPGMNLWFSLCLRLNWIGAVISAVGAIGGGMLSAKGAKDAAASSNDDLLAATNATNAANYRMFQESRGSGGNAVLPLYMGSTEKSLANTLMGIYNSQQQAKQPTVLKIPNTTTGGGGSSNAGATSGTNNASSTGGTGTNNARSLNSFNPEADIPPELFSMVPGDVINTIIQGYVNNNKDLYNPNIDPGMPDAEINPWYQIDPAVYNTLSYDARRIIGTQAQAWEQAHKATSAGSSTQITPWGSTDNADTSDTSYDTIVVDNLPEGLQTAEDSYSVLNDAIQNQSQLVANIFNDSVYQDQLEKLGDVSLARQGAANDAIDTAMARLKSLRHKAGGSGGGSSSFTANQLAGSALQAEMDSSVQDAIDRAALYDKNLALKLGSVGLPLATAQQAYEFGYLPSEYDYRDLDNLLQRLGFFYVGTGNPPMQQTADISPVPDSSQIWGSALSSAGSAIGDYWTTQSLINALKTNNSGFDTYGYQSNDYASNFDSDLLYA